MADDIEIFNSNKLSENEDTIDFSRSLRATPVDGSDGYANLKQMYISFLHVPSGKAVYFKAFLTTYNEAFNSTWAEEEVYGRPDPIYLFKNTKRKISLAFKAPAFSESEAFENLGKVQQLTQFLYPNYTTVGGDIYAQTISQSPLIRLKIMNLVANQPVSTSTDGGRTYDDLVTQHKAATTSASEGLLGVVDNITILSYLEKEGGFNEGPGVILPKILEVNMNFSPIHEHALGWDEKGKFSNNLFPYGVDLEGSKPAAAQADAFEGTGKEEGDLTWAATDILGIDSADEDLDSTVTGDVPTNVEPVPEPIPGIDQLQAGASVDFSDAMASIGAIDTTGGTSAIMATTRSELDKWMEGRPEVHEDAQGNYTAFAPDWDPKYR